MKKLISLFGLLLIISTTMFTSCNPEAEEVLVTDEIVLEDMEFDGNDPEQSWAFFTYDLSKYAGKEATFELSADIKVVNNTDAAYGVWFQVNNNNGSEYPGLHDAKPGKMFEPGESEQKISGTAKIKVNNGASLYLTTHNETSDVKIYVKNFKCLVTYMTSGKPAKQKTYPTDIFTVGEEGSCGLQIGDGDLKPFEVYTSGSAASDIKVNDDGSVEWIATAASGGGGAAALYLNGEDGTIDLANYESIDVEFVYSPITGAWNPSANNPGFAMRILPWDATGIFGGAEDLIYFEPENKDGYGTYKGTLKITEDFINKVVNSADFDAVKAFALKFNDYERGNDDGDKVKVQLKKVKFNKKAGAPADKVFDDGLDEADYGTVQSIYYPTQDYTVTENAPKYEKHGWVYLPAGYDANDKDTKYPVFILLHGYGQNENTWGLSDKGNGGKIKGYMDRRMKSGEAEKFILVCVTGVASQKWGPNGNGRDTKGFNAFEGELRHDLLPYIRANYNVKEGRDNVALAGLSMGGGQTMNIGIAKCLDLISYFGAFSAAASANGGQYFTDVDAKFPDLDINYLYMICGDADNLVIGGVREINDYITTTGWKKLGDSIATQRYHYTEVPGGTHDFPVWYQGFKEYITYIFK